MEGRRGLTYNQVAEKLAEYGFNEISERNGRTKWGIWWEQFNNPLVWLLGAAAGASVLTGEWLDGVLIGAIVMVNGVLGWVQEYKAEDAIRKLKKMGGGKVRVRRSDRETEVDSREIVPGDLVFVEVGGRVVADGKVLEAVELEMDEAVLTGESMPVKKRVWREQKRGKAKREGGGEEEKSAHAELVFAGTLVTKGNGWMEVTQTGERTKFGQLAQKLKTVKEEKTPLREKLDALAKLMVGLGVVAFGVVVWRVGWVMGQWWESWATGVSLAVAVIPEGLPAVMAVTLALGVQKMAVHKAVVRRMAAVEALGAATVVATDKTGTMTKNVMEVKEVDLAGRNWVVGQETPGISHEEYAQMLMAGILASTAVVVEKQDHGGREVIGDQTEGALLKLAQSEGLVPDLVRSKARVIIEYPFDDRLRLMSVVADPQGDGDTDDRVVYVKGAAERVWERCKWRMENGQSVEVDEKWKQEVKGRHDEMAKRGLRVLGLGYRKWGGKSRKRDEVERGLVWLGMVGIADPLRPETAEVLERARRDGVRVVMITGDSELTAMEIAREAGLIKKEEEVMTGEELEQVSDAALEKEIARVRIFARIAPEQKLRIVKALQRQGETVVMTGDGVNDALAIKQADVGVAMGKTGTDVARETADVVLLDDNLKTVLLAVENGRRIVSSIVNTVRYLLACNLGEVITILGAVAVGQASPLLPVQILWVNLVTDGLPALALAANAGSQPANKKVRVSGSFVVGRGDVMWLMGSAAVVAGVALAAFAVWGRGGAFTGLVVAQMGVALAAVGWRQANKYLIGAVALVLGLQALILAVPQLRWVFKV